MFPLLAHDICRRSFSLAYMLPTLVSIVLLVKYGRHYAPASRITIGFAVFLLLLLVSATLSSCLRALAVVLPS